jgi:hypothetical protein
MREWVFEEKEEFLKKLEELLKEGVPRDKIETFTPYPVHEAEELLKIKPSGIRFFTLIGSFLGLLLGFAFTIYTVLSWPLISGGKPIVSTPAFVIIAFELTILFGSISTFLGFFLLSGLPNPPDVSPEAEFSNRFKIRVRE